MRLTSPRTVVAVVVSLVIIAGAGVLLARSNRVTHSHVPTKWRPDDMLPDVASTRSPRAIAHAAADAAARSYERAGRELAGPRRSASAARRVRRTPSSGSGGCWALDGDEKVLTLRVYRGMTLGDLAMHFDTTVAELRRANPALRGSTLLAGDAYNVPVEHLEVIRHRVVAGDTMSKMGHMVDAPTSYSVRAWNCLDTNQLRAGDRLLLFKQSAAPARR